jgi:hypothetical protein
MIDINNIEWSKLKKEDISILRKGNKANYES